MTALRLHHGPRFWCDELQLFRIHWERGEGPGTGNGYSAKLSCRVQWIPSQLLLGLQWIVAPEDVLKRRVVYINLPCVAIRFAYQRSYGGRYP